MLNIITVFKSNPGWDPEYVYKLRDALSRNITSEFRFTCLSDVPLDVDTIPLQPMSDNVPAFWYKLQLFRTGQFDGPCLFIDLDTVIKGPIDKVTSQLKGHSFLMVRSPFNTKSHSSCFMYWEGDHSYLWNEFNSKLPAYWNKEFGKSEKFVTYGDQAFIAAKVKSYDIIQDVIDYPDAISRIKKKESKERNWVLIGSGKRRPWKLDWHPDIQKHWDVVG